MALIKLNNKAVSNATTFGSISSLGSMTFIKKLTASSSATLSFVHGTDGVVLDNTYKEYYFTYNNMHPATDSVAFSVNFSTDSGSNYNVVKTSTYIYTEHGEDNSGGAVNYNGSGNRDLGNETGDQFLMTDVGADADQSLAGTLHFFNPSSTTFVKHFISKNTCSIQNNYNLSTYVSGYANTTSAIDAIRFQMSSGNIDAGDICLYGIA
jgi:hypothetical protein